MTAFNSVVDFSGAKLSAYTDFMDATFNEVVKFSSTTFGSEADFSGAKFDSEVNFSKAKFDLEAYFQKATFGSVTNFLEATFGSKADFGKAKFNSVANFLEATFGSEADFWNVTFSSVAGFSSATFGSKADFAFTTFSNYCNFSSTIFGIKSAYAEKYLTRSNIIKIIAKDFDTDIKEQSIENYKYLQENFRKIGNFEDANKIYYVRKQLEAENSNWGLWIWNWCLDITRKYGTSPARIVIVSLIFIGGFAILYFITVISIIGKGLGTIEYEQTKKRMHSETMMSLQNTHDIIICGILFT